MKIQNSKFKIQNFTGITIIEAMTVLFIFCLITLTFYKIISSGTGYIIQSKNRLAAVSLANEKMEIVRNLKYSDIGTIDGEVSGNIPQDQDVTENGRTFHVNTLVEYVDDPLDGIGDADTVWWEDYKQVTIKVSWASDSSSSVEISGRFVPPGVEVKNEGDGVLSVNVFSDQPGGTGISDSTVHMVNSETGLNTTKETDSSGNVKFMGDNVTDSVQKYEITVTKSGYETVTTMPPYPQTSYNPRFVHATVVTGSTSTNVANIVQNELSDLTIKTMDYLENPIANIGFHLNGGKQIGNEYELPNDPVYNINEDGTTGSNGEKVYNDISPGPFTFTLSPSVTDYELIATDPVLPFSLYSSGPLTLKVKLADKRVTSLLVKVLKNDDNEPITGAQINLKNETLNYDVTQDSLGDGSVFFPETADPLLPETYDLKITANGYEESNSQVTINANELKVEIIKLTATP